MKLNTKQLSQLKTIYLYSDGHAILVFEKKDKEAGTVQWVEAVEKLVDRTYFKGRIIFSSFYEHCNFSLARFILSAERIEATESGSENTKSRGITVHHCSIRTKEGTIDLNSFPGLIGGSFTWQEETVETWEDVAEKYHWSSHSIAKKHLKGEAVTV
jgi:hypothetical protein